MGNGGYGKKSHFKSTCLELNQCKRGTCKIISSNWENVSLFECKLIVWHFVSVFALLCFSDVMVGCSPVG